MSPTQFMSMYLLTPLKLDSATLLGYLPMIPMRMLSPCQSETRQPTCSSRHIKATQASLPLNADFPMSILHNSSYKS